jgi:hypothetical protein
MSQEITQPQPSEQPLQHPSVQPGVHPISQFAARLDLHTRVLVFFSLLTLILSWPLPVRIFGWVPGVEQWAFDESTFVWNIWYFKHSIIDNLSSPLHSDLIYYPLGIDLVLYTYNFFNALIAQPLHVAISLVFASNITVLLSTILSGYGAFLLARYLLVRMIDDVRRTTDGGRQTTEHASRITHHELLITLSSLLAGVLYAFASNRAIYATLGHYDMVTTQWIPFYALTLLQSLDPWRSPAQRRRSALLAGIFFAFNGLAEMITAVFLAIFTLIVVAVKIAEARMSGDADARKRGSEEAMGRRGEEPKIDADQTTDDRRPTTEHAPRITHHALRITLPALAITGIVSFLLWSPVLIPILVQFLTDDFSLKGWGEAIPLSTDLLGWFTPTVVHPIFGGDLVTNLRTVLVNWTLPADMETGFRDVNTVFLGWVSAALALLGAIIYRRQVKIWTWTALIFGIFTLGPFLQINGRYRFDLDGVETSFPLPFALLHYIPIVKANRAPNRNSVLLMLGLAVLAAFAVYWIGERIKKKELRMGSEAVRKLATPILCSSLIFLVLFEHLALPLPLSDAQVPAVYETIAADPQPVSVMHAPLGWRNSFGVLGAERTLIQYYQSVHQKPMLGGNISRAPDFKMDYFQRIPFFQAIIEIESGRALSPELAAAAADQADQMIYLYNVGYVLLMPPIYERYPYADTWQATWNFFKEILPLEPQPFWTGEGIEAYRVVQPEGTDHFRVTLGQPGSFPYRAEGWDDVESDAPYGLPATWATAQQSCLLVPLRQVQAQADYQVTAQIHPFAYPGSPEQTATLLVNGQRFSNVSLANEWQTPAWTIPGAQLRNSVNEICLDWGYAAVPRQVLGGNRFIGATGVEMPLDVELNSFADGAFMSLFTEESGEQIDASAGRRGVNVTVLDPRNGQILEMQGFDTAANEFESEKLANFLNNVQPGHLVMVASRGEAGAFLIEEAVAGLRSLGADVTLDHLQQNYFSIVGVKGAGPGTAAQEIGAAGAYLRFSLTSTDRRSLAAAVGEVGVGRAGD